MSIQESKWTHIQNTAAKETLLLGQIKTVTLNLFHMTGGEVGEEHGVEIDDTETQLDRVSVGTVQACIRLGFALGALMLTLSHAFSLDPNLHSEADEHSE